MKVRTLSLSLPFVCSLAQTPVISVVQAGPLVRRLMLFLRPTTMLLFFLCRYLGRAEAIVVPYRPTGIGRVRWLIAPLIVATFATCCEWI